MNYDGKVVICTALDNKGFKQGISGLGGQLGGLKSVLGKLGGAISAAFVATKIVQFGKQAIELGSNIAEAQNVVDTAFGDMAYKIERFADTSIESFGMSKLSAKKTASTYMAMAKSMGIAENAASDMAISLTGLTGDVASFYNITQEEADTKLKSVFTGETETLKGLGVVMTQTNLDAYAMANGIGKTTSEMTQAELVALRYQYVTDQLGLAQGDFAKTSGSWANQTRILAEQWNEFMSNIGQALIKVLEPALQLLNLVVGALVRMSAEINNALGIDANTSQRQSSALDNVANSASVAANAQSSLAAATQKATNAAKRQAAGFDEMNILSEQSGGQYSLGITPDTTNTVKQLNKALDESAEKADTASNKIEEALGETLNKVFDGKIEAVDLSAHMDALSMDTLSGSALKYVDPLANTLADDLFGGIFDNFDTVISKESQEKMRPLIDSFYDLDRAIKTVNYKDLVIDQSIVNELSEKVNTMSTIIKNGLDNSQNDSLSTLNQIKSALGDNYSDILSSVNTYYNSQKLSVTDAENEINTILSTASKEKRALKDDEVSRIEELQNQMCDTGVKAMSETEVEYRTIMRRIADNTEAVSAEQASAIIQDSMKTRDETIANAEEQYTRQVLEAEKLKDAGAINQEQYDNMIQAAKETKDSTVSDANQQYNDIYNTVTKKLGDTAKYIDEDTGKIKSNWKVWCDDLGNKFSQLWDGVKNKWSNFKNDFGSKWNNFWAATGNNFIDIWNGIVGGLEAALNAVIGLLNKFKIDVPKGVADALGAMGIHIGNSIGFNINKVSFSRVPRLQVPALAQGAVIPANKEFLAVLGDQNNGRNLEAPESLIRQIVREESGAGQSNPVTIVLKIGNRKLGQICLDSLNDLAKQNGSIEMALV